MYTYINRVSTAAPGWFPAVESAEFYADHLIMSPVHRRSCHLSYGPSTCGISCLQLWTCHCRYFGRYTSLCNKKLCYLFRPTRKQTSIFVNSWPVSVLNCGLKMLNAYNYTYMFTIHICLFYTFVLVLFALVELIMHWNMKRFVLSEKNMNVAK